MDSHFPGFLSQQLNRRPEYNSQDSSTETRRSCKDQNRYSHNLCMLIVNKHIPSLVQLVSVTVSSGEHILNLLSKMGSCPGIVSFLCNKKCQKIIQNILDFCNKFSIPQLDIFWQFSGVARFCNFLQRFCFEDRQTVKARQLCSSNQLKLSSTVKILGLGICCRHFPLSQNHQDMHNRRYVMGISKLGFYLALLYLHMAPFMSKTRTSFYRRRRPSNRRQAFTQERKCALGRYSNLKGMTWATT